ncbi:uncharacterized protein [Miscanthus floridulus]|uniref:uncharacterized protein n=1 Tax=Miscanthus floridulus TaxID=154761 RepID=UPI00345857C3
MTNVAISDCCNGHILCRCLGVDGYRYVVYNPATQKLKVLLARIHSIGEARLGFDLTATSHFHVFEYMEEDGQCVGVDIYSSKTTAWIFKESKWGQEAELIFSYSATVFLNSCLHYIGFYEGYHRILAMDVEGKTWRKIPNRPHGFSCSIHQAQGHLFQCTVGGRNMSKLSIGILEDYVTNNKWTLKHTISRRKLFGKTKKQLGYFD